MTRYHLTIPAQKLSEEVRPGFYNFENLDQISIDFFMQQVASDGIKASGFIVGTARSQGHAFYRKGDDIPIIGQFDTSLDARLLFTHGVYPPRNPLHAGAPAFATLIELKPIDLLHNDNDAAYRSLPNFETLRGYSGYIGFSSLPDKVTEFFETYSYSSGTSVHSFTSKRRELKHFIEWRELGSEIKLIRLPNLS